MPQTITREQIKDKIDNKIPMIIVEALPKQYYDAEHLPEAINIPHDEIKAQAAKMLPNKDALIVLYCASTQCNNSKMATDTLVQMGYTQAFEYIEGKQHWFEANYQENKAQVTN